MFKENNYQVIKNTITPEIAEIAYKYLLKEELQNYYLKQGKSHLTMTIGVYWVTLRYLVHGQTMMMC